MIDTSTQKLTIQLTIDQINLILKALEELPGKLCNPIIREIHSQAEPQINELNNGTNTNSD